MTKKQNGKIINEKGSFRVGIAGYGAVGRLRRRVIDEHPQLEVVSICDANLQETKARTDGVSYFSDYKSLLAAGSIDILFVCLPNYLAAEVVQAGLRLPAHVFCEKPPGRNLADIYAVMEVEKKANGKKLMYGFNHRFHDSVIHCLEIIKKQTLGQVISMRGVYGKSNLQSSAKTAQSWSNWRTKRKLAGGGILLDQGIHMIDLIRLIGGDVDTINSIVTNDHWKEDVEDNAYVLLKTTKGVVAMIHSSATQWRHTFHLIINLTMGTITLDGILSSSGSYSPEIIDLLSLDDDGNHVTSRKEFKEDYSWKREVDEFVRCINNNESVSDGSSLEALRTMKIISKIYDADPVWPHKLNEND